MFKKFMILMFATFALAACSKVPAGNVGVKVNLYGSDRGVQNTLLDPGQYWIGWNEELHIFPLFETIASFDKANTTASPGDNSIRFQSVEGMPVSADVNVRFLIKRDLVPVLFSRYRLGIVGITNGPVFNSIRDAFTQEASTMPVDDIYGRGKNDLVNRVEKKLRDELSPLGIDIINIAITSEIRVPDSIRNSIDEKNAATQRAMQRENEVAQARAEAAKAIAVAQGQSEVARLNSEAEAKAIEAKGRALRANPEVLQLEAIQRWNGQMPQFLGGSSTPFIQIPTNPNR